MQEKESHCDIGSASFERSAEGGQHYSPEGGVSTQSLTVDLCRAKERKQKHQPPRHPREPRRLIRETSSALVTCKRAFEGSKKTRKKGKRIMVDLAVSAQHKVFRRYLWAT